MDRTLPGLAPAHVALHIHHRGQGVLDLAVWRGDGPGFVRADEMERYEALTAGEVTDVILAIVDGAYGAV